MANDSQLQVDIVFSPEKAKAQIAAALGVSRNTMDSWAASHPEFQRFLKEAIDLSLAWWEMTGQQNMIRSGFNATAYIFQMKNY